jgi:hypothetical protein
MFEEWKKMLTCEDDAELLNNAEQIASGEGGGLWSAALRSGLRWWVAAVGADKTRLGTFREWVALMFSVSVSNVCVEL